MLDLSLGQVVCCLANNVSNQEQRRLYNLFVIFFFADNFALVDMPEIVNKFSRFSLSIRMKTTELVHQLTCNHSSIVVPSVYFEGKVLKIVSSFTYFNSIASNSGEIKWSAGLERLVLPTVFFLTGFAILIMLH